MKHSVLIGINNTDFKENQFWQFRDYIERNSKLVAVEGLDNVFWCWFDEDASEDAIRLYVYEALHNGLIAISYPYSTVYFVSIDGKVPPLGGVIKA